MAVLGNVPQGLDALTKPADHRPRSHPGWDGTGWETTHPLQGKEAVLAAGQGVRESQGSVALLVAVWH